MSDDKPTDMSNIRHWKIRVEDPEGRDFTTSIGEKLVDLGGREYLLTSAGDAIDHLLDIRERERKAYLETLPARDVRGY
jgi:hypothetical protein